MDITAQWREAWDSAQVVSHTLVDDPAIRPPGFNLPRAEWSLLNRFRTGQGICQVNRQRWGLADTDKCECGEVQTMSHILESCDLTKFDGGILELHKVSENALSWLKGRAISNR